MTEVAGNAKNQEFGFHTLYCTLLNEKYSRIHMDAVKGHEGILTNV